MKIQDLATKMPKFGGTKILDAFLELILIFLFTPFWVVISLVKRWQFSRDPIPSPRLVWGPTPLINNKYWSNALRLQGFSSETFMYDYYSIFEKRDFDKYPEEVFPFLGISWLPQKFIQFFCFTYALQNYDIFHFHFSGGFLGKSIWAHFLEAYILKFAKCKIIVTAYGSDYQMYSRISHVPIRHGLLLNYPLNSNLENLIQTRIQFWTKWADAVLVGAQVDGIGRWDALPYNMVTIDTDQWSCKKDYSRFDGKSGPVTVVHSPNHRGIKGTEFIIAAVDELKSEGLKINFVLMEGKKNTEVHKLFENEADILIEQLTIGYGLNAMEGMATGLPVLSNLDLEDYTRVFRRYSYLNECPILSTTPENIKENLKRLIKSPQLREILGKAGRRYVEKYHSNETAQFLFGKIYEKIWFGKNVDLLNLFHPLTSEFNKRSPLVKHPLIENKLPPDYYLN